VGDGETGRRPFGILSRDRRLDKQNNVKFKYTPESRDLQISMKGLFHFKILLRYPFMLAFN
jgi:hypothetical protein